LLGKTAAARTWLSNAEQLRQSCRLELRACHVGDSLQAMSDVYNLRYKEAETHYRQMLDEALAGNAAVVKTGDLQYGLASVLAFLGRENEAFEYFLQARKNIGIENTRIQNMQLNIFISLYFPDRVKDLSLSQQLAKFLATGCYDPFWAHMAGRMLCSGVPEALHYIEFHVSRTPPTMLKQLLKRIPGLDKIAAGLQPRKSRAEEFFTQISRDSTRTLHYDEYLVWQAQKPDGWLIFDAPAGLLYYSGNKAILKAGSIPYSALLQLFMAQPHPIAVETLYKSVWGNNYDPEFDGGAFKSTVQRLKRLMQSLVPSTRISFARTASGKRLLKLVVPVPWMLVFK
jgi:hypothetical protein